MSRGDQRRRHAPCLSGVEAVDWPKVPERHALDERRTRAGHREGDVLRRRRARGGSQHVAEGDLRARAHVAEVQAEPAVTAGVRHRPEAGPSWLRRVRGQRVAWFEGHHIAPRAGRDASGERRGRRPPGEGGPRGGGQKQSCREQQNDSAEATVPADRLDSLGVPSQRWRRFQDCSFGLLAASFSVSVVGGTFCRSFSRTRALVLAKSRRRVESHATSRARERHMRLAARHSLATTQIGAEPSIVSAQVCGAAEVPSARRADEADVTCSVHRRRQDLRELAARGEGRDGGASSAVASAGT